MTLAIPSCCVLNIRNAPGPAHNSHKKFGKSKSEVKYAQEENWCQEESRKTEEATKGDQNISWIQGLSTAAMWHSNGEGEKRFYLNNIHSTSLISDTRFPSLCGYSRSNPPYQHMTELSNAEDCWTLWNLWIWSNYTYLSLRAVCAHTHSIALCTNGDKHHPSITWLRTWIYKVLCYKCMWLISLGHLLHTYVCTSIFIYLALSTSL